MARKTIEIIKCDRCGKEFDGNPLERRWFKHTLVFSTILINVRKKDRTISREHIPYDLCKECSESLADWFIEGKQKNT